jgi:Replication initiation factor
MKWDYASVVVWGLDQVGIDGQYRFDKAVVDIAYRLGATIEIMTKALNGYSMGFKVVRNGVDLVKCLTGGTGDAEGSSQFIAASTADEVYPIIKEKFKRHNISRLDAAEDYCEKGAFEKLELMLAVICKKHRVSMSPFGEGHIRPDGTRDCTKGRTWYCGSPSSNFRIVLYEKGIEQIAKGIPDNPDRVRVEVRVKPKSSAKGLICMVEDIKPVDLFGMSAWGIDVAESIGAHGIRRINIGAAWKPKEKENAALTIVKMFSKRFDQLLIEEGSAEAVGALLYSILEKHREAKGSISQLTLKNDKGAIRLTKQTAVVK